MIPTCEGSSPSSPAKFQTVQSERNAESAAQELTAACPKSAAMGDVRWQALAYATVALGRTGNQNCMPDSLRGTVKGR